MMASFECSTIAAKSLEFSSSCLCLVTSRAAVITNNTSPVSRWDKLMFTGSSVPFCCRPLSCRSRPMDRLRGSAKYSPVLRVDLPEILRHQHVNGLADQVVTVIAEQ